MLDLNSVRCLNLWKFKRNSRWIKIHIMQHKLHFSFHRSDIFGGGGCHFPWLPSPPPQCQCEGGASGPITAQQGPMLTNKRPRWRPSRATIHYPTLSPLHASLSLSPRPGAGHTKLDNSWVHINYRHILSLYGCFFTCSLKSWELLQWDIHS